MARTGWGEACSTHLGLDGAQAACSMVVSQVGGSGRDMEGGGYSQHTVMDNKVFTKELDQWVDQLDECKQLNKN